MKSRSIFSFALVSLALAAPAFAQLPVPAASTFLEPFSKWQVDYAENSCQLFRSFGDKGRPVFVQVDRGLPSGSYSWWVGGLDVPAYSGSTIITVAPATGTPEWKFEAYPYSKAGQPEAMIQWLDGANVMARNFADDQQLVIRGPKKLDLRLNLMNVKAALKALDTCQDDLMATWGLSADALAAIAKPPEPTGSPGRWVTNDDYPPEDKKKINEGTTSFLLNLSAEGKITACRTMKSSGFESLDKRTCQLVVQRGTFRPAEDATGNPVASYYSNRVRWQLPR